MRKAILNRTNPNDRGFRQDRRDVAVVNGLGIALRASFSWVRLTLSAAGCATGEHLAGYRRSFERLAATAMACAQPATDNTVQPATGMSRLCSPVPSGGWQFTPAAPRGSKWRS